MPVAAAVVAKLCRVGSAFLASSYTHLGCTPGLRPCLTTRTSHVPCSYFEAAAKALGKPPVLEPENAIEGSAGLAWTATSWNYGYQHGEVPLLSKLRLLEPRHMPHVCNRWATDHVRDILSSFFNGIGFVAWEVRGGD